MGYALRCYIARKKRFFLDNVAIYIALTEFQRKILIKEGYPEDRIAVIPNMVTTEVDALSKTGSYVGYAGRISPEKGILTLLAASRKLPDVPFCAAGGFDRMLKLPEQAPEKFKFVGHLSTESLNDFFLGCRMIILPSICFEGFPTILAEAMIRKIPVISSRIGGLSEIVEDGVTGLLFEPGNADELAKKIRQLWDSPDLCLKMGQAGAEKARHEYSTNRYYERLNGAYKAALLLKTFKG
jgi:glycosyltransferase involved in cell wall biosynthesis